MGQPRDNHGTTTGQHNISKDNLSKDNLNQDNSVKDNNNYYTLDTTVNHNSEVNYNTIPTWLNDNSIKQLKKGNPNNLTFRIPIAYLNQLTGSNYYYIDGNINLIKDLLNQGYTVEDFKQVIEFKVYTWFSDYETRKYLTPSVLFEPTNFERYLEEAQKAPNNYSDIEDDLPF